MASFRYPLEEIRERCDIEEIISPYVALKRSGKNLKGLCPFHAEKTPSFIVNKETQRWMCFGCGTNGDIFDFVMRIEGLTFPEAAEQLAAKAGINLSRAAKDVRSTGERDLVLRINALSAVYFRKMLEGNRNAIEYLRKRGIVADVAEKFKLGYAPPEWSGLLDHLRGRGIRPEDVAKAGLAIARERGGGYYDRFRNRLVFPILDVQNRPIAFGGRALGADDIKYLNSPETRVFVKNKTLYALNFARKPISEQDCVILVEGYMDALTAHAAGFVNVVATMGTALTSEHVRILSRYTKNAVLAYDSDSAGMAAAIRSAPMFEEAEFEVRAAPMPEGEDPDSLIRKGNPAQFAELVENAVPIPDYRLRIIAAKHDTSDRAGQLALLKEAIPVVAEVSRQVERERLIAKLAPYHPNYRGGTVPAELHLRQEVEAQRNRAARKKSGVPAKQPAKVSLLSEEGKAVRRAELELLSNIICHGHNPAGVFSQIQPSDFVSEDAKNLAAAVQEETANGGKLNIDALSAKLAETGSGKLLTELLVTAVEEHGTPLEDLVQSIKIYHKKEQEKRFRFLAEKFEQGEIKRTDKEFAEYWQLVRELHI